MYHIETQKKTQIEKRLSIKNVFNKFSLSSLTEIHSSVAEHLNFKRQSNKSNKLYLKKQNYINYFSDSNK